MTLRKTFLMSATAMAAGLMVSGAAFAAGHAGNSGYALSGDGSTLTVMKDIAAPAEAMTYELKMPVSAIAYRPVTGDLLGYSNGAIFTINPMSGEMTDLSATFMDDAMIKDGAVTAFDFNNKIDAVRAVSSMGDNLVYFPDGFGDGDEKQNSVRRFTDLAYAEGDANAGKTPMIFANAYTNAIAGAKASDTFQYAIDAETDALVSLANNAGTLETIGAITVEGEAVDVAPVGGIDIVSKTEGEDAAYAILSVEGSGTAGLYAIDLTSGAATLLSDLGSDDFSGFAVYMGM